MSVLRWVELESRDDGVRLLTLNRPPVNALGREIVEDLAAACETIRTDGEARCVVVRSSGKHFSAGADLKERQSMSLEEVREFVGSLGRTMDSVASLPVPTIAAVRGAAAGGGCELALACDIRIMAEDAKIGLRETALAIIPGAGGTQRLPRLVGPSRAKLWITTAAMFSARDAEADGAVDRVVPPDSLDEAALAMASTIASNGPVAVRLAKRAIDAGIHLPMDDAVKLEWECYEGVLETEDRIEALRAFAAKRPPDFKGR